MGAMQRRKGAAGEREWVAVLRLYGYDTAGRELDQSRDGGGDVIVDDLLFEVKRYHSIAVRKWLDQACVSADAKRKMPVVAMREDGRTDWMVLVRASDFLDLVERTRGPAHDLNATIDAEKKL